MLMFVRMVSRLRGIFLAGHGGRSFVFVKMEKRGH